MTPAFREFLDQHGESQFWRIASQKCYGQLDHLRRGGTIVVGYVVGGKRYTFEVDGIDDDDLEYAELAAARYKLKGNT